MCEAKLNSPIRLTSDDKKDIRKYVTRHESYNDETGEESYYEYDVIFLRNEWDNEKCYQVAICRKNEECENADKQDLEFWFDVKEWNQKKENKIIEMIQAELKQYFYVKFNDVCKSQFENI
jgi:hypothetical protein